MPYKLPKLTTAQQYQNVIRTLRNQVCRMPRMSNEYRMTDRLCDEYHKEGCERFGREAMGYPHCKKCGKEIKSKFGEGFINGQHCHKGQCG